MSRRAVHSAESVRQLVGVGDQGTCPNGNEECLHGSADVDAPCFDCLVEDGDQDE